MQADIATLSDLKYWQEFHSEMDEISSIRVFDVLNVLMNYDKRIQ